MTKDFEHAAEQIKNLKSKPTDDEMLAVYGLYKQATVGDINISKPTIDPKGKAKWTAWNSHKGLSQDAAKHEYVESTEKLVKKYGVN